MSVRARLSSTGTALRRLAGGLGTALYAGVVLIGLVVVGLTSLVGIGLPALPLAGRALRAVADAERARLTRIGPAVIGPGPAGRPALNDPAVRGELRWLAGHATFGLFLGLAGLALPIYAVQDLTFPLWWWLLPAGDASASGFIPVHDWAGAFATSALGLGQAVATLALVPWMAARQADRGRQRLGPPPGTDLTLRVAELTATRAAALDAHSAELRRIERSLHDGAQNRLVAVTVLLGAARRAVTRDPAVAGELLEKAQGAAELALAELREVVRGILPPVLVDRGLAGALTGLAAASAVPCRVDVAELGRCPASVEATAYFVVAEALTNITRHSRATHATVTARRRGDRLELRITDDGRGGAGTAEGSGLAGMRRRVEAHDGVLTLTSPPGGPTVLAVELPC